MVIVFSRLCQLMKARGPYVIRFARTRMRTPPFPSPQAAAVVSCACASHTGRSVLRRPSPARSTATPMYGPTTGALRAKAAMVPKKSPNRTMMPYSSTQKPMRGHRNKISSRPPKKAAVPLAFCLRAKKRRVLAGPMMMVRPMRKRICQEGSSLVRKGGSSTQGLRFRVLDCLHCPWRA